VLLYEQNKDALGIDKFEFMWCDPYIVRCSLSKGTIFSQGYLVLLYEQDKDVPRDDKFEPMWCDPYIMRSSLSKGTYALEYYDGNVLCEPHNGFYLKRIMPR